jgi:hypothetical protein
MSIFGDRDGIVETDSESCITDNGKDSIVKTNLPLTFDKTQRASE